MDGVLSVGGVDYGGFVPTGPEGTEIEGFWSMTAGATWVGVLIPADRIAEVRAKGVTVYRVWADPPAPVTKDIVRVLRVIEYVGTRAEVEKQVANSVHGTKAFNSRQQMQITAVTVGEFPETLLEMPTVDSQLFDVQRKEADLRLCMKALEEIAMGHNTAYPAMTVAQRALDVVKA